MRPQHLVPVLVLACATAPLAAADAPGQKPWFTAHLAEIDADHDGVLTLAEVEQEITRAFTGYDVDSDGRITADERERGHVKTALGGFIKGHAAELDANGDGAITRPELTAVMLDMFHKQDANGDGRLDAAELAAPQRPPPPGEGRERPRQAGGDLPPASAWPTRLADGWSWTGTPPGPHRPGDGSTPPPQAAPFLALGSEVRISWDDQVLFIESLSLPHHPLMAGITAWNQQVPLPQPFLGRNAFRLPLHPVALDRPQPLTLEGAVAIAVNGVPIFAPTTQSGKDAFLNGELDTFGGHCGRADDYHYHLAPVHLQAQVGPGQPVAFGLDGYPIQAGGDGPLDEAHGWKDADGTYRYRISAGAPYYMGAFHGQVDLAGRPRTMPVRPFTRPLRGATITGMTGNALEPDGATLTYSLRGGTRTLRVVRRADGGVRFTVPGEDGTPTTEDYPAPGRRPEDGGPRGGDPRRPRDP